MSRINEDKLNKIVELQGKIAEQVRKLEELQSTLNEQERVLTGGWAFVARNPWTATDIMMLGGETVFLQLIIQLALNHVIAKFKRSDSPPQIEVGEGGFVN